MTRSMAFVASLAALAAQAQMAGWTPEVKRVFTASCRAAIIHNGLRDGAARNNVPLESISSEKRAEFERAIEPFLAPCSCVTDYVSSRWTFADYNANHEQYKPQIQALITTGPCVPKAPK